MEAHNNGQDWVVSSRNGNFAAADFTRRGVLTQGTFRGTLGVLLHFGEDIEWADVAERNGNTHSRPVAWIALAGGPDLVGGNGCRYDRIAMKDHRRTIK